MMRVTLADSTLTRSSESVQSSVDLGNPGKPLSGIWHAPYSASSYLHFLPVFLRSLSSLFREYITTVEALAQPHSTTKPD